MVHYTFPPLAYQTKYLITPVVSGVITVTFILAFRKNTWNSLIPHHFSSVITLPLQASLASIAMRGGRERELMMPTLKKTFSTLHGNRQREKLRKISPSEKVSCNTWQMLHAEAVLFQQTERAFGQSKMNCRENPSSTTSTRHNFSPSADRLSQNRLIHCGGRGRE